MPTTVYLLSPSSNQTLLLFPLLSLSTHNGICLSLRLHIHQTNSLQTHRPHKPHQQLTPLHCRRHRRRQRSRRTHLPCLRPRLRLCTNVSRLETFHRQADNGACRPTKEYGVLLLVAAVAFTAWYRNEYIVVAHLHLLIGLSSTIIINAYLHSLASPSVFISIDKIT